MHVSKIAFRKDGENSIIEMKLPNGDVAALPATDIDPASGQRWCDVYGDKYGAFTKGVDPDRVAQLEGEIAARQAELDAMKPKDRPVKPAPESSWELVPYVDPPDESAIPYNEPVPVKADQ